MLLYAVDNVDGQLKSAMCLVVRGNKIVNECSASVQEWIQKETTACDQHPPLVRIFQRNRECLSEKVIWQTCNYGIPDLTVLEFFLFWGYFKNTVYTEKIRDLPHLKDRICLAIETVTPEMQSLVWEKAEYRLDICRATNDAHIETF